jgi:hypothetical protein
MTARLLRQLGCTIHGDPGTPRFKIVGKQELPPQVGVDMVAAIRVPADSASSAAAVSSKPVRPSEPAPTSARAAAYTKLDTDER